MHVHEFQAIVSLSTRRRYYRGGGSQERHFLIFNRFLTFLQDSSKIFDYTIFDTLSYHIAMASNFVPQPHQPQAMETNNDARAFQALILSLSLLSKRDLCSISLLNSEFLAAARENHLWQPIVSKLEQMPLHDYVDVSSVDFPSQRDMCTMFVPPRISGEIRNHYTCDLHPRDHAARLHPKGPLILKISSSWWHGGGEFNEMKMENGKLYDGFYRTQR